MRLKACIVLNESRTILWHRTVQKHFTGEVGRREVGGAKTKSNMYLSSSPHRVSLSTRNAMSPFVRSSKNIFLVSIFVQEFHMFEHWVVR